MTRAELQAKEPWRRVTVAHSWRSAMACPLADLAAIITFARKEGYPSYGPRGLAEMSGTTLGAMTAILGDRLTPGALAEFMIVRGLPPVVQRGTIPPGVVVVRPETPACRGDWLELVVW
jgi:hypothetical protein